MLACGYKASECNNDSLCSSSSKVIVKNKEFWLTNFIFIIKLHILYSLSPIALSDPMIIWATDTELELKTHKK